jgi:Domain of unknown function (DUF4431)
MAMTTALKLLRTSAFTISICVSLNVAFLVKSSHASDCLAYEPANVNLTGVIVRKTFPGPPNYESVHLGDKPETTWLLVLPKSICVDQDKNEPDLNAAQKGVVRIQLVFLEPKRYRECAGLVGKRVIATGTLYGAHTGHHHTPVLLTVGRLAPAQDPDSKP